MCSGLAAGLVRKKVLELEFLMIDGNFLQFFQGFASVYRDSGRIRDMAWTPPTKHLRKKELLDPERFYRLLSEQSNYMDPEVAIRIYLGMVMVIVEELRKHKFIRLPILGDFAIVRQKSRPAWVGKSHCVIDGMEILKFYPKETFRRDFNNRQTVQPLSVMPPPPINSN
jgi:hypothetical protein